MCNIYPVFVSRVNIHFHHFDIQYQFCFSVQCGGQGRFGAGIPVWAHFSILKKIVKKKKNLKNANLSAQNARNGLSET